MIEVQVSHLPRNILHAIDTDTRDRCRVSRCTHTHAHARDSDHLRARSLAPSANAETSRIARTNY